MEQERLELVHVHSQLEPGRGEQKEYAYMYLCMHVFCIYLSGLLFRVQVQKFYEIW